MKMVKRVCSFLTLIVLVLVQCFTSINYVLAEDNAEQDFQIEENTAQEELDDISESEESENLTDEVSKLQEDEQEDIEKEEPSLELVDYSLSETQNYEEKNQNEKDEFEDSE